MSTTRLCDPSHSAPSLKSRKRSSSFTDSNPAPRKLGRTMTLRRTASYLSLADYQGDAVAHSTSSYFAPKSSQSVPYSRTLHYYKEQRERRKDLLSRGRPEFTLAPQTSKQHPKPHTSSATPRVNTASTSSFRTSSPLAPSRKLLPPRASFPRSKPEPDLYRVAIRTRMRGSPMGEKILLMGPRSAMSVLSATRELERLVSACSDADYDISMSDGTGGSSWIVLSGDDWEMHD
ncbi:hypothetical protein BJ138DRAFT_730574 [Hygrophoropsis aurantiaca]|uniref:Uncharacterized protein n=1 Tax=Hygrophoropsis aurantiaca TaxID=72124 RepID=A0ACB8AHD0_9AGAM|nr:hypothetical protein BJ138DRAFT_730574 [Hygrophoropsis aurantiaca]